jgi:hypothetical protein
MNSRDGYGDNSYELNPTSPPNAQPASSNTERNGRHGPNLEVGEMTVRITGVVEPEHNLATEMNSFRMSAGMWMLNRTFIGMHVDFITMGVEYLPHIMYFFFPPCFYSHSAFMQEGPND